MCINSKIPTLNARVAAVSLVVGAIALHVTNQLSASIVPIRRVILGILVLGTWAFCDEMGMRKLLNRAAFICFVISMLALAVSLLGMDGGNPEQFYLIYAMALLFAVLIWSGSYLHRSKGLKMIGAAAGVAALLPVAAIIGGHVFIGMGAFLGVSTLLDPAQGESALGSIPLNVVEAVFVLWCVATAVLLLRGHIVPDSAEMS